MLAPLSITAYSLETNKTELKQMTKKELLELLAMRHRKEILAKFTKAELLKILITDYKIMAL